MACPICYLRSRNISGVVTNHRRWLEMNARQELLGLIDELSDAQIAMLLTLVLSVRNQSSETPSSESSQAYRDWLSSENDIYDEAFANDLATR